MDDHGQGLGLARLVPPPGGERRLRLALHGPAPDVPRWRLPLAAAAACLCLLPLAFALRPDPMDARVRQAIDEAVAIPEGIRVAGARVEHVTSLDPGVRVYRLVETPAR